MKWKSTMFNRMFVKATPRIPKQVNRNKVESKTDLSHLDQPLSERKIDSKSKVKKMLS